MASSQAQTQMSPTSTETSSTAQTTTPKMRASNVNFFYGAFKALHDISLAFEANRVTALIGPSGCGKSTFLRNLNRINETLRDTRIEGEITLDGENILDKDVTEIRRRIGNGLGSPIRSPQVHFREHCLWPENQRYAEAHQRRRNSGKKPPPRCPLGRSQRQTA